MTMPKRTDERPLQVDTVDKVFFRNQDKIIIREDTLRRNIDSCISHFGF